jgi:hypothetical protein
MLPSVSLISTNKILILLATIIAFTALGLLAAISPAAAILLITAAIVVLLASKYTEQAVLLALAIAPLGTGLTFRIGLLDLRLVQLAWMLIILALVIKNALGNPDPVFQKETLRRGLSFLPPLALLSLAAFLSTVYSPFREEGIKETIQLVYLLVVFIFAAAYFSSMERLLKASDVFAVVAIVMALIDLVQYLTVKIITPSITVKIGRGIQIITEYPNIFMGNERDINVARISILSLSAVASATYIIPTILICLILLVAWRFLPEQRRTWQRKLLYISAVVGGLFIWYISHGRAAQLVLPACLFVLWFLYKHISWKQVLLAGLVLAILGGILVPIVFPRWRGGLDPAFSSNAGHYAQWLTSLQMFTQKPLFGYGPNAFVLVVEDKLSFAGIITGVSGRADTHNVILKTAAELGLAGLIALLWFFSLLLIKGWQANTRAQAGIHQALIAAYLASIISLIFMLQTNNSFHWEHTWYYWALGSAAFSLPAVVQAAQPESSP